MSETWPVLDREERRVLGVLIEKQKTTPDAYPMSVNGVMTGCNQKSNRDPVMDLPELDVEDALEECFKKGLANRIVGGRVEKWRHLVYEAWKIDRREAAILAELLLRGPQTEGELRTRASRMEPFEDLEALRGVLRGLGERKLVVYLTSEDRRGATLTHGFHAPEELEALKRSAGAAESAAPPRSSDRPAAPVPAPVSTPAVVVPDPRLAVIEATLATLTDELRANRHEMQELRDRVAVLEGELDRLKSALGTL